MKKTAIVFLFFVIATVSTFAQRPPEKPEKTLELQLWSQTNSSGTDIIPWIMYYGSRSLVIDLRYNYDDHEIFGAFVGRQFGDDGLYFIPQIGFVGGHEYKALSPEFYLGGAKGRFAYFSQWQWTGSMSRGVNSWAYQYNDLLVKIVGPISLGVGSQTSWEKNTPFVDTDVGPILEFDFDKGWSARIWVTNRVTGINCGDHTFFFAVGKVFKWK